MVDGFTKFYLMIPSRQEEITSFENEFPVIITVLSTQIN
jgi:hypothetical protein